MSEDITPFNLGGKFDMAEMLLAANFPPVNIPTEHALALGFYVRKVVMPKDSIISTKIHGVASPFVVTKGSCVVKSMDGSEQVIEAPYVGITQPGTRRIIYITEECHWVTFQKIEEDTLDRMFSLAEEDLMIPNPSKLIDYRDSLNRPVTPFIEEAAK